MGKLGYFVQFQLSFYLTSRLSQGIPNKRMGKMVFQFFPPIHDSLGKVRQLLNKEWRAFYINDSKWVCEKQADSEISTHPGAFLTNSQESWDPIQYTINQISIKNSVNETCLGVSRVFYSKKTTKKPTHPCHQWNPERPLDRPLKKRNSPSLSPTEVRLGTIDFGSASLSEQMLNSKGPGSFG